MVGSALLLGLGPAAGIWLNPAVHLPLTLVLSRTRATGHRRDEHDVLALAVVLLFLAGVANVASMSAGGAPRRRPGAGA